MSGNRDNGLWFVFLLAAVACNDAAPVANVDSGGGTAASAGQGGMVSRGGAGGGAGTTAGMAGSNATGGDATAGGQSGSGGLDGTAGAGGAADVPPPCAVNQIASCTGTDTIECHFGGEPGDYEVTLDLGGAAAGDMYVEAESHRRMLGPTTTAAGENRRFSFFVNVRQPEGQPVQDVPSGTAGLDIYVRGASPELAAICYTKKSPEPKLWIAGDSTVCDQSDANYSGWGQHLPQFFSAPVSIANYADSGESSGSVLGSSKLWGAIKAGWKPGDWVMIQLGHNDKNTSAGTFRSNLESMVTQAKDAGVNPILVTPISRVGTDLEQQHVNSTGADLPQIISDLAADQDVPLIDLTTMTWEWLQTVDWKQYFALGTDKTHPNPAGAGVIAGFVRDAIVAQDIPLAAHVR